MPPKKKGSDPNAPKKKRGRKPKNKQVVKEKPPPKKRGRKPKPRPEGEELKVKITKKRGRRPKDKFTFLLNCEII